MTAPNCQIVGRDERIVHLEQTFEGVVRRFYAIRDAYMGCWRTVRSLASEEAWRFDRELRAEFPNREEAVQELKNIRRFARENPC